MTVNVVTQAEVDDFKRGSKAAARKMAAQRPSFPQHRSAATIQAEIDRNVEPLTRFSRELSEKTAKRKKVVEAIGSVEGQIAALKDAGVAANHYAMQKLNGYTFSDKHDQKVFKPGLLQNLQEELATLDRKIKILAVAIPNTEKRLNSLLPGLKTELEAAKNWERLI